MKIKQNMSLELLAEAMGPDATIEDAQVMRELLIEQFDGLDTQDIPENEWLKLIDEIAKQ